MDLRRFKIGDVVRVTATVEGEYKEYPKNKRVLCRTPLKELQRGQIVGLKRIQLGEYQAGSYEEQSYLKVEECITVWLIRLGMLNRPVCALDKDVKLELPVNRLRMICDDLPLLCVRQLPWTKEMREEAASYVRNAPRDKKGRWTKEIIK